MIRLSVQRLFILVLLFLSGSALQAQIMPPPPPPPPPDFVETKPAVADSNLVFNVVEDGATFPGGNPALMKFLQENLRYPQRCKDSGYNATIYMQFIVEKDGSLSNIKLLKGFSLCPEFEAECRRVIMLMPRWNPGRMQGKALRQYYNLPVKFKVD